MLFTFLYPLEELTITAGIALGEKTLCFLKFIKVSETARQFSEVFSQMDDEYMQARSADVKDISRRIIEILLGVQSQTKLGPSPIILLSNDFVPSETAQFDRTVVMGLITTGGSQNSHTAIFARTMGSPAIVDDASLDIENDAEGIGLFRSEFLYLEQAFGIPSEENPALGMRAIRICLARPDVFKTQLRALYRASAHGRLSIMLPMITSVEEVKQAKSIMEEVRYSLDEENIPYSDNVPVGIMIETPTAALSCAFFYNICLFGSRSPGNSYPHKGNQYTGYFSKNCDRINISISNCQQRGSAPPDSGKSIFKHFWLSLMFKSKHQQRGTDHNHKDNQQRRQELTPLTLHHNYNRRHRIGIAIGLKKS